MGFCVYTNAISEISRLDLGYWRAITWVATMSLARLNIGFWLVWSSLFVVCYFNSWDDPSSIFYNENRAYEQKYSLQRAADARKYLKDVPEQPKHAETDNRFLCIGIPSINRTSESFLAYTVATLTDTLSVEERASVHLVVLLADKVAKNHFAYRQPWLEQIANKVLIYDVPSPSTSDNHANSTSTSTKRDETQSVYRAIPYNVYEKGNGRGEGRVENMRLDHSVLVETCREHGSPYFALVEDDIIASKDWFGNFKRGLRYVEAQSQATKQDWIYLRLFYSELFMGWNSEEWLSYCQNIFAVYTIVLLLFLARTLLWRRLKYTALGSSTRSSAMLMALILGLWLPAVIALYFVAGRISVSRLNPFTRSWHGAREMPAYGCCAQGMVFPQRHLEGFQALLRNPPYHLAGDQILEGYAGEHSLKKWALEPSVFQHVGLKQSSAGDQIAEVWNFSFERQQGRGEVV